MSILSTQVARLAGKTVMSGIQPSGVFHMGNLLGAVNVWVDMCKSASADTKVVLMVADMHSITVPKKPDLLREYRWQALASIIASGVDPVKANLYFQSQVPGHAQLHWLLESVASMGYLGRMAQWKSKSHIDPDATLKEVLTSEVNLALFAYPVLMAADILANDADLVPVGDDQSQHLELTRHLVQAFNHRFGNTFKTPKTVLAPTKRILSLRNPNKKMSKSDSDKFSCLNISDSADEIAAKLKRAVTDSVQGPITFDPVTRPGVANLVNIAAAIEKIEPTEWIARHRPANHQQLKELITEAVCAYFMPIRNEYARLMHEPAYLESVSKEGAEKAIGRTNGVVSRASRAMGF